MIQILDFVKYVGGIKLADARVIVDATLGNGHDALWLKKSAKNAKLYGFDIQEEALKHTKKRLLDEGIHLENIQLIHDSHANMGMYIQEPIDLLLFNFGYLPGGNKQITTQTETSLSAIVAGLNLLASQGIALLVMYPGHEEGEKETEAVKGFIKQLDWHEYHVYCYQIMNNTKKPPLVYIIRKLKRV